MSKLETGGIMYKIVLLGPDSWALKSIHHFVKKHLSDLYDVREVCWADHDHFDAVRRIDPDLIIGEASIVEHYSSEWGERLMPVWHHFAKIPGVENAVHARDYGAVINKVPNLYSITNEVSKTILDVYGRESTVLPIGADLEFWHQRDVGRIKKITAVFDNRCIHIDSYREVKRPDMFMDIGSQWGGEFGISCGMSFLAGSYIYQGDAVVCTSVYEGNPMALMECAAARIPFISTPCGLTQEYDCVKTFETVEEAVDILNDLNSDPKKISDYCDQMYEEVALDRDWKKLIQDHWIPAIEEKLKLIHGDC